MPKNFTDAEKADILAMYRTAKNKGKQIGILAQLNACSRAEIIQVLGLTESALPAPRKQRNIPPEVKQTCCDEVLDGKEPVLVARKHGVSTSCLYRWVKKCKANPAVFHTQEHNP